MDPCQIIVHVIGHSSVKVKLSTPATSAENLLSSICDVFSSRGAYATASIISSGVKIFYQDDENEWCRITSREELEEAFRFQSPSNALSFRLFPSKEDAIFPIPSPKATMNSFSRSISVGAPRVGPASFLPRYPIENPSPVISVDEKFATTGDWKGDIQFFVNGKAVSLSNPSPSTMLVTYLRDTMLLRGTKIGCFEGGCGACTVMMSWVDAVTGAKCVKAVNSCLQPVSALNGRAITTIEGVGSVRAGVSAVQKALAVGNGSQCGFCSPGWVMRMTSVLQESPFLSEKDVEDAFAGNLCRCTGYRPILQAFRAMVGDGTAGSATSCSGSKKKKGHKCSCKGTDTVAFDMEDLGDYKEDAKQLVSMLWPEKMASVSATSAVLRLKDPSNDISWFTPSSLAETLSVLQQVAGKSVQLFVGNTSFPIIPVYSVDKAYAYPDAFVDIRSVPEMRKVELASGTPEIRVGGAVTLDELLEVVNQIVEKNIQKSGSAYSPMTLLQRKIKEMATPQAKAVAGWAGNLSVARTYDDFSSDLAVALIALNATVDVIEDPKTGTSHNYTVADIVSKAQGGDQPLMVTLHIPVLPFAFSGTMCCEGFRSSMRAQNAISYVSSAIVLDFSEAGGKFTVHKAQICFSGVSKGSVQCKTAETALTGATLTDALLQQVFTAMEADFTTQGFHDRPFAPRSFKITTAEGMLYRTLCLMQKGSIDARILTIGEHFVRPLSTASDVYLPDPSEAPVSEPIPKLTAQEQCTGEALYTDDIPPPYSATAMFVRSPHALAKVVSIDTSAALAIPGVLGVYTAADIPGKNDAGFIPGDEVMFTAIGQNVTAIGQPVAMVVAETSGAAFGAVDSVKVVYSTDGLTPILTLADSIAKKAFFVDTPYIGHLPQPLQQGDVDKALSSAAHTVEGAVACKEQKHLYMEPQTAFAVPYEGKRLQVHVATQGPCVNQASIMNVLGIKAHDVDVKMLRCGGAFGGKLSRGLITGCGAALGAYLLGRPVHMAYHRDEDLQVVGAREPMSCTYKAGVDDDNKLVALDITLYMDSGCSVDCSFGSLDMAQLWCDGAYYVPNVRSTAYLCRTNLPTNTAMRGPGAVTTMTFMEAVVDHLAETLGVDPIAFRQNNFYTAVRAARDMCDAAQGNLTPFGEVMPPPSLPTILDTLQKDVSISQLQKEVSDFNAANKWRKQGLAFTPTKYGMGEGGRQSGCTIRVFPEDGTIIVNHGGCELGQGIDVKVAQVVSYTLGVPLQIIRVAAVSTDRIPNNTQTGGSGTSESCAEAARLAALELNDRLAPVKEANPGAAWKDIVAAAAGQAICLSVEGWFAPVASSSLTGMFDYFVYGIAVSVVEVNALSGVTRVVKSHIVYDCGVSLNPAVDIGQVEGAYVQGIGYYLHENIVHDKDGLNLANTLWDYHVPSSHDIPLDFSVHFLKNSNNTRGIMRSKATGEPPYHLASSVLFATLNAVREIRKEIGAKGTALLQQWPMTPDAVISLCGVSKTNLSFE